MTTTTEKPKQYHAEGTCDVSTYKAPARFAAFTAEGDSVTRQYVLVEFGLGVVTQLQGRIITFERPVTAERYGSPGVVAWMKTIEARAERVHVQSIYALSWPS